MAGKDIVLMIGNPGTGKSTLLNALIGSHHFKSGMSAGSGMTYEFNSCTHQGVTYSDTPGLEDVKLREQAAAAINQALKQDGTYRLFFVMTEESGRIRPADVQLMDTVLNAIEGRDVKHCIIFNKLSKKLMAKFVKDDDAKMKILSAWNSGTHRIIPENVFPFEKKEELEDEDDVVLPLAANHPFRTFVSQSPRNYIAKSMVKKLDINTYDQKTAELETRIVQLQQDKRAMQAQWEESRALEKSSKGSSQRTTPGWMAAIPLAAGAASMAAMACTIM